MTELKTRPRFIEHPAESVKSEAWKNLSFLKDGRTIPGTIIYPSEEAASEKNMEWEMDIAAQVERLGGRDVWSIPYKFWWSEYSHTIQIPWKP